MSDWRARVVDAAVGWLHTPWHHCARVKGAGVDCGQLALACYVEAGVLADFDPGWYTHDWMLHRSEERYLAHVLEHLDEVSAPQPGDMALWKFGRCFSHGAIVTQWPSIIHAYRPSRKVCWGDGRAHTDLASRPVRFFSIEARIP